jgi:hypothetical protein
VRRPDLTFRTQEGEAVIVDPEGRQIHHLNETAAFIWLRCDGQTSVSAIGRQLAAAFEVGFAAAKQDLAATLVELESLGLVAFPTDGPREG